MSNNILMWIPAVLMHYQRPLMWNPTRQFLSMFMISYAYATYITYVDSYRLV